MSVVNLKKEEELAIISKKEELAGNFHNWLLSHFNSKDSQYLSMLTDVIDDDTFYDLAEIWAEKHLKHKVFY